MTEFSELDLTIPTSEIDQIDQINDDRVKIDLYTESLCPGCM